MIKDVAFDFRVDGKSLKGSAHLDVWPGDAAITDGTIEGDRISFTVVGKIPSTTGLPKFRPGVDATARKPAVKLEIKPNGQESKNLKAISLKDRAQ